jgi:hypothetical protein
MKTISQPDWERKMGFLRFISTQDIFTLPGTSEAENTSSSLPKPLDILCQLFSSIPSHYLEINRISRLLASIISLPDVRIAGTIKKNRICLRVPV